jgi:bifunctional non-homologous end joining protein LigD
MLCQSAERPPPEGPEWRYELKLDGFRAIGRKAGRTAQLVAQLEEFRTSIGERSKSTHRLARRYCLMATVVALDEDGRPSFNLLQGFGEAQTIVLGASDLLMLRCR